MAGDNLRQKQGSALLILGSSGLMSKHIAWELQNFHGKPYTINNFVDFSYLHWYKLKSICVNRFSGQITEYERWDITTQWGYFYIIPNKVRFYLKMSGQFNANLWVTQHPQLQNLVSILWTKRPQHQPNNMQQSCMFDGNSRLRYTLSKKSLWQ